MKKESILLDIDEVVCFSGYLELVNEFLNTNYSIDDFKNYYIDEEAIGSERMDEFNEFIKGRNHYENPIFLPNAVRVLKKLSKYYDIYPLSACISAFDLENSGKFFKDKFDFLYNTFTQEEIPAKNYIFTSSKELVHGDIQIDDLLSNLSNNVSLRILFPSYHNKDMSVEDALKLDVIKAGDEWEKGWINVEKILSERLESRGIKYE